jgi:hypothetical protein
MPTQLIKIKVSVNQRPKKFHFAIFSSHLEELKFVKSDNDEIYYSVLTAANFDQKSDLENMGTVSRPELLTDFLFVKVSKSVYSSLSLLSHI